MPAVPATHTQKAMSESEISSRIATLLANSYNDSDFKTAFYAVEQFISENTPEARRDLRPSVQATIIKQGGQTLKEFGRIEAKLEQIGQTIGALNDVYKQMDQVAESLQYSTRQIVSESRELGAQEHNLAVKQTLLAKFEQTFEIPALSQEILTLSSTPVDKQFFECLDGAKRILVDCETLFAAAGPTSKDIELETTASKGANDANGLQNSSAVQVMKSVGQVLDRAYEKLVYFVQKHLRDAEGGMSGARSGQTSTGVEVSATMYTNVSLIRQALTYLQDRPLLFQSALGELEEARRKVVSSEFNAALADGDGSGVKPIDYYAYDPLQYLGDIMAALHTAIVGEKELLEALFGNKDMMSLSRNVNAGVMAAAFESFSQAEYLDRVTSVLIKPLRLRVERLISSESKMLTVHKEGTLLLFYAETFQRLYGLDGESSDRTTTPTPQLLQTLAQLSQSCMRQFDKCLDANISHTKQTIKDYSPIVSDLQSPEFLTDALAEVKDLFSSHEGSILSARSVESSETSNQDGEKQTDKHDSSTLLVAKVIDPYIECCTEIAERLKDSPVESAVFLVNCLTSIKNTIAFFTFAQPKLDQVEQSIDELMARLTQLQLDIFIDRSGLKQVLISSDKDKPQVDTSKLDSDMAAVDAQLEDFLPAATMESGRLLGELSSSRMASNITLRASVEFAELYDQIKQVINATHPEALPRTVHDVKILLAVD